MRWWNECITCRLGTELVVIQISFSLLCVVRWNLKKEWNCIGHQCFCWDKRCCWMAASGSSTLSSISYAANNILSSMKNTLCRSVQLNTLYSRMTPCGEMDVSQFSSGNGSLPDCTKPLLNPMSIYHQRGPMAYSLGELKRFFYFWMIILFSVENVFNM